MISRALRGKCPLLYYSQGKSATRKSPRGRAAIRAAPPCCPCLVPCAFAPVTTTQRQSLEKLGKGGQALKDLGLVTVTALRACAKEAVDTAGGFGGTRVGGFNAWGVSRSDF